MCRNVSPFPTSEALYLVSCGVLSVSSVCVVIVWLVRWSSLVVSSWLLSSIISPLVVLHVVHVAVHSSCLYHRSNILWVLGRGEERRKQGISSVVGVTLAMSRSLVRFEHHLISVHDPLGSSGQGSNACFYFLL